MYNPDAGEFVTGQNVDELLAARQALLSRIEPAKRSSLEDDRNWPVFRVGETVSVVKDGARAVCVVESIGKQFIRLRAVPVPVGG